MEDRKRLVVEFVPETGLYMTNIKAAVSKHMVRHAAAGSAIKVDEHAAPTGQATSDNGSNEDNAQSGVIATNRHVIFFVLDANEPITDARVIEVINQHFRAIGAVKNLYVGGSNDYPPPNWPTPKPQKQA